MKRGLRRSWTAAARVRTGVLIAIASIAAPAHTSEAPGPPCPDPVPIWKDGAPAGTVCAADAAARGLTVIDLGDDWTPRPLALAPDGDAPPYRATYLALAAERFADAGVDGEIGADDRYLEPFGIEPTLSVVRARLDDDERHACHAGIDPVALAVVGGRIVEEDRAAARARIEGARDRRVELERLAASRGLADVAALAPIDPRFRAELTRLRADETRTAAIGAVQAHLACDGLLVDRPIDGAYTWQTSNAVERFQRGAMILPRGNLDDDTRAAMLAGSRELAFRTALRVLRERVVAATGLIEDGTAGAGEGLVRGRALEPDATWRARGGAPLDDAAPDLVSAATEAAARALGWTDPVATRALLDAHAPDRAAPLVRVAVALPPLPAYHGPAMDLSVEIDRGDVWHDATPRWHDAARRPALILYAQDGDRRIALARWPTTIGGWQDVKVDDGLEPRWKESPVGAAVWRDLYVGPTWLAPDTTPDRELAHQRADGTYELASWVFGPSYRSAYGLIALVHHVEELRRGGVVLDDRGIRAHGTGNLASLATGVSHGCHRLLGLQAMRLAGFLLAHRASVRRGPIATVYHRVVRWHGTFRAAVDERGYLFELTPPIRVDVLPGRVHDADAP